MNSKVYEKIVAMQIKEDTNPQPHNGKTRKYGSILCLGIYNWSHIVSTKIHVFLLSCNIFEN
jgi:hypothetical protein